MGVLKFLFMPGMRIAAGLSGQWYRMRSPAEREVAGIRASGLNILNFVIPV
jgi:hypothetical protein